MSGADPRSHSRGCGGDAAAYALGSLEPAEASAFGRHLESCVVCRDELAALQRVADALPMAAPQYAVHGGLRRRVLRDVRAEPRLARGSGQRRRTPLRSHPFSLALPRPALTATALLAVAVTIMFAAGLGFVSGRSGSSRVLRASVQGLPGSAQLRVAHGHAELIVHHLPPPPAGSIYEVWLVKHSRRAPYPTSALFSPTSTGDGDVDVPGDLRNVGEVMVTQEPAGGSQTTTHAPVITARLPRS
ncbi:MAG: anti-sigma factor domain-containing protein [Solirubrobacteraceae bacterium]